MSPATSTTPVTSIKSNRCFWRSSTTQPHSPSLPVRSLAGTQQCQQAAQRGPGHLEPGTWGCRGTFLVLDAAGSCRRCYGIPCSAAGAHALHRSGLTCMCPLDQCAQGDEARPDGGRGPGLHNQNRNDPRLSDAIIPSLIGGGQEPWEVAWQSHSGPLRSPSAAQRSRPR